MARGAATIEATEATGATSMGGPLGGLAPVHRESAVDAVTEQLREKILAGDLAAGQRLPPERELAAQLRVNRLTLRAGLSRLEALGLIATQHGVGTVVRDYRQHGGIESLPRLLSALRARDGEAYVSHVRDVLELRRTIAVEAVALAAERHTAGDLALLRTLADAQRERTRDVFAYARGDVEFARAVVRAGRNVALELLLNTVGRFPDEDPLLTRAMYPRPRAQQKMYDALLALIATREASGAREALRRALERLDARSLRWIRGEVLGRAGEPAEASPRAGRVTRVDVARGAGRDRIETGFHSKRTERT